MQSGCVQVYYGDGKGKTTAAMGQALRAVGHGMKVLIYQFLKEPTSGEIVVLRTLPGVTYIENEGKIPFLFNLTEEQSQYYRDLWHKKFDKVCEEIASEKYDLVVLDEVIDAMNLGIIDKSELYTLMETKPESTELVLTGHQYGEPLDELFARADYVTKCVKEKHPFDRGQMARVGIEK